MHITICILICFIRSTLSTTQCRMARIRLQETNLKRKNIEQNRNGRNTARNSCCAALPLVNIWNYHRHQKKRATIIWKDEKSLGQVWKDITRQWPDGRYKIPNATHRQFPSNISTLCSNENFGTRLNYRVNRHTLQNPVKRWDGGTKNTTSLWIVDNIQRNEAKL